MSAANVPSGQDLRYPIGRYQPSNPVTPQHRTERLRDLEQLPTNLRQAVAGLSESQLDTP
jgi:hypothetical protein